jgi:hypothetical protein
MSAKADWFAWEGLPMAFAKQAERVVRSANPGFSC